MGAQMTSVKKNSKKAKSVRTNEYTKSLENLPSFYINNTQVMVSNFDFKLTLGQLIEATKDKVLVDPQVTIFMSPQHAKAVSNLLTAQLEAYETNHGPIPTAKEKAS